VGHIIFVYKRSKLWVLCFVVPYRSFDLVLEFFYLDHTHGKVALISLSLQIFIMLLLSGVQTPSRDLCGFFKVILLKLDDQLF